MAGYWGMPEETADAMRDGWFYTGDIATMDEDGYFTIVDRKKDMILASGLNVYPREVEEVLYEHPAVLGDTLRQYLDPKTLEVRLPRLPFDPARVPRLTITACGSAFLAGLVGRYWIEKLARLPVDADVASELRYRDPPLAEGGGVGAARPGACGPQGHDHLVEVRAAQRRRSEDELQAVGQEHGDQRPGGDVCQPLDRGAVDP